MIRTRHGPKPGCHEVKAHAEAFSMLEAKVMTHFSLEAVAEAKRPKAGYCYSAKHAKAFVNHENEVFENHEAKAESMLSIFWEAKALIPKKPAHV